MAPVQAAARTQETGSEPRALRRKLVWLWQLLVVGLIIAAWYGGLATGILPARSFVTPIETLEWVIDWFAGGTGLTDLGFTFSAAAIGYVIGVVLGAIVAITFVAVPFISRVFDPFMTLINGIPKVILAPFLITVFGLGLPSKVAVAALLVFVASFFNLWNGLKSVDRVLIDNVKTLGSSTLQRITSLYIPAMATWSVATLRLGFGLAVLGVVVGEFVGATHGVGWNISQAASLNQPARLLGAMLTLAILALIIDRILVLVEARFDRWRIQ